MNYVYILYINKWKVMNSTLLNKHTFIQNKVTTIARVCWHLVSQQCHNKKDMQKRQFLVWNFLTQSNSSLLRLYLGVPEDLFLCWLLASCMGNFFLYAQVLEGHGVQERITPWKCCSPLKIEGQWEINTSWQMFWKNIFLILWPFWSKWFWGRTKHKAHNMDENGSLVVKLQITERKGEQREK